MAELEEIARAYARCFAGPDGQAVLADLRRRTLDRALAPDAPPAALRHLEGQRALVVRVLGLALGRRDRSHDEERTDR